MITVFTPTFNRAAMLPKLINSLEAQTDKDFEWIIVDDGSEDDTEAIISNYRQKTSFPIIYERQENQGKHIAYNKGINLAKGELFFCLDSDDELSNDAIEQLNNLGKCKNSIIGYVFPSVPKGTQPLDIWNKISNNYVDIIDMHEMYNIAETCIVFNTHILKKYKFPQYDGVNGCKERFCPEGLLYNKMIGEGKFLVKNNPIYIYEYQQSGLTNKVFSLWKDNFNGVMAELVSRFMIAKKYSFFQRKKTRIKSILNCNALCMKCKQSIWKNSPSRLYSCILFIPSIVFMKVRFKHA